MAGWIQRVSAMFGARGAAPLAAAPLPAPAVLRSVTPNPRRLAIPVVSPMVLPAVAAVAEGAATIVQQRPFIEWLLDTWPTLDIPIRIPEQHLLGRLDTVLASDKSRSELLPRARAVIPQLLNSLRDERQSVEALVDRITRDPHLVAEVLRLANGSVSHGTDPVGDLPQAIHRLGTDGLRRVIASVVLKPMFHAQADALSARAESKLWLHSEAKAAECLRLAEAAGLDPFEGYLAGLMHNVGWTAALRAIDRSGTKPAMPFSREFVDAFDARREMFFALLMMHWQLSDALTALATEVLEVGLHSAPSPLGQALLAADQHASMRLLEDSAATQRVERRKTPRTTPSIAA
jgi:HD-like signal output (HDOD) protein